MVELWPGGGWYTEILAPYVLSGGGTYYAAALAGDEAIPRIRARDPARYGAVRPAVFPSFEAADTRVPDGSADVVLTFRNVHNWRMGYRRDRADYAEEAFRQIFRMLRPGGTLGVVDHRLPEDADAERERTSGYVKVSTVRRLAEAAGFRLVDVVRGQRQSRRHSRLARRRLDPAARAPPRRARPRALSRHRRKRPHDSALRETGIRAVIPARNKGLPLLRGLSPIYRGELVAAS